MLAEQAELPDVTIESRIDNLSRAVSALNACPQVDLEQAREIQDRLDVALVQHRVSVQFSFIFLLVTPYSFDFWPCFTFSFYL